MSTTLALYFFQGDLCESVTTPNAFMISPQQGNITFENFLNCFPFKHKRDSLHFRFKTETKQLGYVWKDVTQLTEILPQYNGVIFSKILKLDDLNCSKRKSRLKLKSKLMENPNPNQTRKESGSARIATTTNMSKPQVTNNDSYRTEKSIEKEEESEEEEEDEEEVDDEEEDDVDRNENTSKQVNISQPTFQPAPMVDMMNFGPSIPKSPSQQINPPLVPSPETLDRETLKQQREASVQENVDNAKQFLQHMNEVARTDQDELENARLKHDRSLTVWATNNKEKRNVRTLLTTMHTILWPGHTWKPIGLGDVLQPKQVKLQYRKAMLVVHPDRSSGQSAEQRFIAKRIFEGINEAYQEFLKKESVD